MTNKRNPAAPPGLGPRAKKVWADLNDSWGFQSHELELLKLFVEALDRAHRAQNHLDEDGIVVKDRFGQLREHPAVQIRNAAEASAGRLLRQLGFDEDTRREVKNKNIRHGVHRQLSEKRRA